MSKRIRILFGIVIVLTVTSFVSCPMPVMTPLLETVNVLVNGTPHINLKQGSVNLADSTACEFGTIVIGTTRDLTFTVENLGKQDLTLSGNPLVALAGSPAFSPHSLPTPTIGPGTSTTFVVRFAPTTTGNHSAIMIIRSNDPSNASISVTLNGTGTPVPVPSIAIMQGSTEIASGTSVNFGSTVENVPKELQFSIQNRGTADLELTGTPIVTVSGAGAGYFVVPLQPSSPVAPGGSVPFSIIFTPPDVGPRSATVTITSNDLSTGTFSMTLSGSGTATPVPAMNVKLGSTTPIPRGGSQAFGSIPLGSSSSPLVFTIYNIGTADLLLTGNPLVVTSGSSAFSATQPADSTVHAGGSTTFTVTFAPSTEGALSGTVSIANNDAAYSFTVTGVGAAPVMKVLTGANPDIATSGWDCPFGNVRQDVSSSAITFTVQNNGNAPLNLTGNPNRVSITGADSSMFSVVQPSSSTIAAGGSTTFSITFTPSSTGSRSATVLMPNNDPDRTGFTFTVSGTGTLPGIQVKNPSSVVIPSGTGSYGFGNISAGAFSSAQTFTISNTGTATLNLTGNPRVSITGTGAAQFSATVPAATVAAGGSTTFNITFSPTTMVSSSATISIVNDVPGASPYTFTVTGSGIGWVRSYSGGDLDAFMDIQPTSDGGSICVGMTGSSNMDILVMKLTQTGAVSWQKAYGGSSIDQGAVIQPTSDGGYVLVGKTYSWGLGGDAIVIKLDSAGGVTWARTIGGNSEDSLVTILQTSDGGYICAGSTNSFGAGSYDGWLVKLDSTGALSWQKTYGGTGADYFYAMCQSSLAFAIVGQTGSYGSGANDVWLVGTNTSGVLNWAKAYGGFGDDVVRSIQWISTDYIMAGYTKAAGGKSDVLILKTWSTGLFSWAVTIGGADDDTTGGIQGTADGGYIFAGSTKSYGQGAGDWWVMKLNSSGAPSWQKTYGGSYADSPIAIRNTTDGGFIAAGWLGTSTSMAGFVEKLDPTGMPQTTSGGVVMGQDTSATAVPLTAIVTTSTSPSVGTPTGALTARTVTVTTTTETATQLYP